MRIFASFCLIFGSALSALAQSGPEVQADNRVTFRLYANQAENVTVRGQWGKTPIEMVRPDGENAAWTVTTDPIPAGVWEYRFLVDGMSIIDPFNPSIKPQREPNTSILHVPGSPLNPWDFKSVPHGTVHNHSYFCKSLGRRRDMVVYTPPGYETDKEKVYPLLVLQHGSGDNQQTWVAHGKAHWILDSLLAEQQAVPMIVLMIDGHPQGQVQRDDSGAVDKSLVAFGKELFEDAIPLLEAKYRVETKPERRAIAGLSMGGWQSINVGLQNLDRFAWIGSFSGAADVATLGTTLNDPKTTNEQAKLIWIACGKEDFLLDRNLTLVDAFKSHGVKHQWSSIEGDHSWPVWRTYLNDFLPLLFRD